MVDFPEPLGPRTAQFSPFYDPIYPVQGDEVPVTDGCIFHLDKDFRGFDFGISGKKTGRQFFGPVEPPGETEFPVRPFDLESAPVKDADVLRGQHFFFRSQPENAPVLDEENMGYIGNDFFQAMGHQNNPHGSAHEPVDGPGQGIPGMFVQAVERLI